MVLWKSTIQKQRLRDIGYVLREDKKEDVMKQSLELLKLLYYVNKKADEYNELLPILSEYNDEEEYFDKLFTIIISLKEENAKLLDNLNI